MSTIPETLTLNGQNYSGDDLRNHADFLSTSSAKVWEQSLGKFLLQWLDDRDYIEVMTSGSTGAPKLIKLCKKAMLASAALTGEFLGLHEGQTALLCLRVEYIAGMMMVVRAMALRMNLVAVPPDGYPLDYIHANTKIDFAAMVPAQVYNSLKTEESRQKLESFGTLIIGGAPVSPDIEKLVTRLNGKIFATFGMTETITHIALRRLNGKNRSDFYTVLSGITIETDERGCLVTAVPHIEGGKVTTNDLVNIVSSTTFRWLGRADHVINCGGKKLIPEEIERKIAHLISHRFFIAPLPDKKLGEIPVLVMETMPMPEIAMEELLNQLMTILRKEETPRVILQTGKFEETENGKINRKESVRIAMRKES